MTVSKLPVEKFWLAKNQNIFAGQDALWLCDFNSKHAQNILPVNCIRSSDYRKAKSCGRLAQNAAKAYIWIKTKRIILKNVRTESGMPLRLCDNMEMFKDVEVIRLAN